MNEIKHPTNLNERITTTKIKLYLSQWCQLQSLIQFGIISRNLMGEIEVRATSAAFKVHVSIVEQLTWYSICRRSIWVCINCTAKRKKNLTGKKQKTREKPQEFWNLYKLCFSKQAEAARIVLAIPAKVLPSEKVWSDAGNIVTDARQKVSPINFQMLLFLKENLNMWSLSWPNFIDLTKLIWKLIGLQFIKANWLGIELNKKSLIRPRLVFTNCEQLSTSTGTSTFCWSSAKCSLLTTWLYGNITYNWEYKVNNYVKNN